MLDPITGSARLVDCDIVEPGIVPDCKLPGIASAEQRWSLAKGAKRNDTLVGSRHA